MPPGSTELATLLRVGACAYIRRRSRSRISRSPNQRKRGHPTVTIAPRSRNTIADHQREKIMRCMMASARCRGLLLACLLLAPFAAEAQQVKLRLTSQLPSSHFAGVSLAQFKDEVERRTEKTLTIEIFDDGRLYKDDEVIGAVSSGAIDMGFVVSDRFAEKIAAVSILQQPFLFNFEALVRTALSPDQEMRRLIDKAILEATGSRVLWWLPLGSTVILSKGQSAISPAEISKLKIRVLGTATAAFIERCGGIPALLNAGDQLSAMKDGRVDMTMTGVTSVTTRQLWKVTDTITRTDNAAIESTVIINEAVWQRLSEGHKTIVMEVARKVEQKLRDEIARLENDAYRFARENGIKVYELAPYQVAEWRACSAPVLDAFMAEAGESALQLMRAYGKLRTSPCCSAGPSGAAVR
jgi:C4-dicarboxylate-binding protein DctP